MPSTARKHYSFGWWLSISVSVSIVPTDNYHLTFFSPSIIHLTSCVLLSLLFISSVNMNRLQLPVSSLLLYSSWSLYKWSHSVFIFLIQVPNRDTLIGPISHHYIQLDRCYGAHYLWPLRSNITWSCGLYISLKWDFHILIPAIVLIIKCIVCCLVTYIFSRLVVLNLFLTMHAYEKNILNIHFEI